MPASEPETAREFSQSPEPEDGTETPAVGHGADDGAGLGLLRGPGQRLTGVGRRVYAAGALALTEPGPSAAGIVITDEKGRTLAHRAQYLGRATLDQAVAQALLSAMRVVVAGGLEAPVFRVDHAGLVEALTAQEAQRRPPAGVEPYLDELRHLLEQLPGSRIEGVSTSANLARPVALAPLIEWLPERTRRAEGLNVRPAGDDAYDVESESHPGQVYRVAVRAGAAQGPLECQCADFQYRGIPCKHLLAVARETGGLDRLFYTDGEPAAPPDRADPDQQSRAA